MTLKEFRERAEAIMAAQNAAVEVAKENDHKVLVIRYWNERLGELTQAYINSQDMVEM